VSSTSASPNLMGLIFVIGFLGLMLFFGLGKLSQSRRRLREIPAFLRLKRAIGLAVESGQRLHISLGHGGIDGTRGASGLVGLSVIQRVSRAASISDKPPIATSGEAGLAILSQDVLHASYRAVNAENRYDAALGQLTGLTPLSYTAGALPAIYDQQVSVNLLLGSFGSEVGLLADAAERTGSLTIGGSDNLPAQAVLFASTKEPLVGEELFAAGAYLQVNPMHASSLIAQDVLRWVLIGFIILGAALKLAGVL
jgi:hypothetical protein